MLLIDIRLFGFEIVVQRETAPVRSFISRPAPGEIIIDLPYCSVLISKTRISF